MRTISPELVAMNLLRVRQSPDSLVMSSFSISKTAKKKINKHSLIVSVLSVILVVRSRFGSAEQGSKGSKDVIKGFYPFLCTTI